jgi:hypothetical protein
VVFVVSFFVWLVGVFVFFVFFVGVVVVFVFFFQVLRLVYLMLKESDIKMH